MVGIPGDRMFSEMPEAEQGPDMPGNAPRPDVGGQLAMYRREINQMAWAMRYYIGYAMNVHAPILNRAFEQHRAENPGLVPSVAQGLVIYAQHALHRNVAELAQNRLALDQQSMKYINAVEGEWALRNPQAMHNILQAMNQQMQQSIVLQQQMYSDHLSSSSNVYSNISSKVAMSNKEPQQEQKQKQ